MNEKKAKKLRAIATTVSKDKSPKGIRRVYQALKALKMKHKYSDL